MILDPVRCEWRKSQASSDSNACVEVAVGPIVGVRDTKAREAGHLALPVDSWSAFVHCVKTNAH